MNLDDVRDQVTGSLGEGDLGKALSTIKNFVHKVIQDESGIAEVFGSKILDALCLDIGRHASSFCFPSTGIGSEVGSGILILASHIESYGGHSKVCLDLIDGVAGIEKIHLIVTDLHEIFDKDQLLINCPVYVAPKLGEADKLVWLINEIGKINPQKIILFNHHQDAVCIAAIQPFLGIKQIIYYHHADHNLALGVHLPSVTHIDPTIMGYYSCRNDEGIKDNLFFPLTVKDRGSRLPTFDFQNIKTCSCGSYGPKFGITYKYNYLDFVIRRLKIRSGIHFHVGNIPADILAEFKKKLALNEIQFDRFVYIPYVSSLWDFLRDNSIDLYIASFPMSGARATMEAMGSGIPILIHVSSLDRFFSGIDSAYPEAFLWKNTNEFDQLLISLDQKSLEKASLEAREHYLRYHSRDFLVEYMLGGVSGSVAPPPLREHSLDRLDAYLFKRAAIYDSLSPEGVKNLKKIERLEWENKVLKETKDASESIINSWRGLILRVEKSFNHIFKIINRFTYLIRRVHRIYKVYGLPLFFNSYSYYLVSKLIKLLLILSVKNAFKFIKTQRLELSKIFIFEAKNNISLIRVSPTRFHSFWGGELTNLNVVIFDHFGGGGSNFYTTQLVMDAAKLGNSVLRIGFYDGYWYLVEGKNTKDGQYFSLFNSIDQVFIFLSSIKVSQVIFNSLYGVPNLEEFVDHWKLFSNKFIGPVGSSFVLHDFYSICPSLHLMGSVGTYCGVPENKKECNTCYSSLDLGRWSHSWIEVQKLPTSIERWRSSFFELFSSIDVVIYFNKSSVTIFSRAFPEYHKKLKYKEVDLNIHSSLRPVRRSPNLNIGVIGDLSSIKGAAKVKGLAEHILQQKYGTPITILGSSPELPSNVRKHGSYTIESLPDLVEALEISVIFFASIVPETFSYVLTEIFKMKLPVVCFNLGAQGDRVLNYPLGVVLPTNATSSQIYDALEAASHLYHNED